MWQVHTMYSYFRSCENENKKYQRWEEKLYLMDWKLKATSDANKKVQFAFQSNV